MTDVRVAAARVLLAVNDRGATLGTALDAASTDVPPVDRGLLIELTAGVLRWRNTLDAVIASAGKRSVRDIEPPVLAILRLGTYQLRFLDRIPAHAVVHSSVAAVRTLGRTSASGLVNAVLRAIVRRGPAISLPARPGEDAPVDRQVNYLATTLSHPAWLVRRWIARSGFEAAEAWCRFNNAAPDITVRSLDGLAATDLVAALQAAGVAASPARYVDDAVRLPPGALGDVPERLRSRLWVQDEAAQLVARLSAVTPGERVLDACAAPGGKTLVLARDLDVVARPRHQDGGPALVAADHRPGRVALLQRTLVYAGLPVPAVRLDARTALPFGPIFDCVLLDAPCSGLGTLRREPDLKWSRNADDLPALAAGQRQMLRATAGVVRPGGRLVYATCSSEPDENEDVVRQFLAETPEFARSQPDRTRVPASLIDDQGQLVPRPDRDHLEPFFAAVLVRREGP